MKRSYTTPHPRRNVFRCSCARDTDRLGRLGETVPRITCSDCRRRAREWHQAEGQGQLRFNFATERK